MRISGENRVLGVLLVFVPATLVAVWLHWPLWVQFFLSVAAVIPLAGFIGSATEELADRVGARTGGLLNATFGNAPDFLIGFFGIQRGLIPLVKATLIGALISNSALILGLCYIAAGLIHGRPRFRRAEAGHHSVLMLLTVAAILFPSAAAMAVCRGEHCIGAVAVQLGQRLRFGVPPAPPVAPSVAALLLHLRQQPPLLQRGFVLGETPRTVQQQRLGLAHRPDHHFHCVPAQLLERRDALVAIDHHVAFPVVSRDHHDDGRLLAALSQ